MAPLRSDTGRPVLWLHVGPMKTGTTYLQQLVYANREALATAGLVLPGERWSRQVRGVQDVMGLDRFDRHVRREAAGAWAALLEEVRADPGRVSLISVEFLSFASPRKARQVLRTLDGVDVRVLMTVRDMTSALPSQWQTLVHNGATFSWPDYLRGVPAAGGRRFPLAVARRRATRQFRRTQDLGRMVRAWQAAVPPGAVHVVTVPRRTAGPDELWRRVASVIGVDPAAATEPPPATNPSLGYASVELVRRINLHLGRIPRSEYNWTLKETVALRHLSGRAQQDGRVPLVRPAYDLGLAWNAAARQALAAGVQVTGDLDVDLPVRPDPEQRARLPQEPPPPDLGAMLDSAEVAARALRELVRKRVARLRRAGVEVPDPELVGVRELRRRWEAAPDPVDAAASDLAGVAREGAALLRRLREVRAADPA